MDKKEIFKWKLNFFVWKKKMRNKNICKNIFNRQSANHKVKPLGSQSIRSMREIKGNRSKQKYYTRL